MSLRDDRPVDPGAGRADQAHLRETPVHSSRVYRGSFLDVRRDEVRLPDGGSAFREYIVHPGAVMVVPMLDDGRLIVERQYRYPVARVMLEFPAGKLEFGEPPLDCAMRELAEETGYRAAEWARAGLLHNAIAYSTEGIEIWFARGLSLGERSLDQGEFVDVDTSTLEAMESLAQQGALTDVKTLVGMMWLRAWRKGRWRVDWSQPPALPCPGGSRE